ncbi:MAG: serine/threonine-protein kinase [Acidobacteriota bacterium]
MKDDQPKDDDRRRPEDEVPTLAGSTATVPPARRGPVGPYTPLERLGRGGMGEVWLAEQKEPIQRRVALKLIRSDLGNRAIFARFESERQALALMDHPAIARVYEAGTSDDGRPYFAMEYVPGEPITEYCDRHRVSNRDRLRLMIDVCRGVQHAHQKAIIHRDLKPSNILVRDGEGRPQPKIIDFGIAKAVGHKLTDETMYTQIGQFVGTLDYMSPEQADPGQLGVDTRADVYALGVVLYKLLTGELPFDSEEMRRVGYDEARRRIREVDPPRPSTRVSSLGEESSARAVERRTEAGALRRELEGDLDWIVLKALEKDRSRRYDSPAELATDLQRFLDHEPVTARPPSAAYRAQKFVRRHRVGVAFGSLLALAGLLLVLTTLLQNRRIAAERDRANREALAANAALDFMADLFNIADPSETRGNSITAREVLDRGAERIGSSFEELPEVRARMMGTIGRVYESLGLYEPAEEALEAALDLQRASEDGDPMALAEALSNLGFLKREQGDIDGAEEAHRESLALRLAAHGDRHLDVAEGWFQLSIVHGDRGEFAEALEFSRRAHDMAAELAPEERALRQPYLRNTANSLADLGRNEEALPVYREILDFLVASNVGDSLDLAFAHDNLGLVLHDLSRMDEAETHYREAHRILLRLFGPEHPEVAQTHGNLADFLLDSGQLEEAEKLSRRATELSHALQGESHYMTADHQTTLVLTLLELGRVEEAAALADDILPIYRRSLPEEHPKVAEGMAAVGAVRLAEGRLEEAETLLKQAYERAIEDGVLPADLQERRKELEELFLRQGEEEAGERWIAETHALAEGDRVRE